MELGRIPPLQDLGAEVNIALTNKGQKIFGSVKELLRQMANHQNLAIWSCQHIILDKNRRLFDGWGEEVDDFPPGWLHYRPGKRRAQENVCSNICFLSDDLIFCVARGFLGHCNNTLKRASMSRSLSKSLHMELDMNKTMVSIHKSMHRAQI